MIAKSHPALRILLVVFALIALAAPLLTLEPPTREQIERYRAEGTLASHIAAAKRFGNFHITPWLARNFNNKLQRLAGNPEYPIKPTPPPAWRGMPTKGTVRVLSILVDFSDAAHISQASSIESRLYGSSTDDAPYDTLRNYYQRSSYGQLLITGDSLGWYRAKHPRGYYESLDHDDGVGVDTLIKEAVTYYDAVGFNFAPYDNDNDGTIDYIVVIWAGRHGEWSSFWWGYQWQVHDTAFTVDGKHLGIYSWQWESYRYPAGVYEVSTVIHETGHALGLPDYYDYDDTIGPNGGVGGLDMMDSTIGDHNCFSKFLLDWIEPTVITASSRQFSLRESGTTKDALLVMSGYNRNIQKWYGEFFMVQNRESTGNDANSSNIASEGLLIWHVDSRLTADNNDFLYDNSYSAHKLLRLMEADGHEDIENGSGWADGLDYYTNGKLFGPRTRPNSKLYNGTSSGVFVSNISAPGEVMSFNSGIELLTLDLSVVRGQERSWLKTMSYATIFLSVTQEGSLNPAQVNYQVWRCQTDSNPFLLLTTIPGAQFQNNAPIYIDKYFPVENKYSYYILAVDASGNTIGTSEIKSI
jgi:M6 family metalloprotease-like protein